jgi:hypothetical protein
VPIGVAITSTIVCLIKDIKKQPKRNLLIRTTEELQNILHQIEELDLNKDMELTGEKQQQARALLKKYVHIFAPNPKTPQITPKVQHNIYTADHPPIQQHAYCLSPTENELAAKEIQEMLKNKIIRKSKSPWTAPIVLDKNLMDLPDSVLIIES